ncbi:MAG TPA: hypothetical protein VII56_19145 [Rhizomicrobium sp.]
MTLHRDIDVDGQRVTIAPLKSPRAGERHCALMRVAVIDETTGHAPLSNLEARLTQPVPGASVRVLEGGLIGVEGKATRAFTPSLAATGSVALQIRARGFAERDVAVTFACAQRALVAASAGAILTLDSNAGLSVSQRILVGSADGTKAEIATIVAIGPGAGQVTLAAALSVAFAAGSDALPLPPDQAIVLHRDPIAIRGRVSKRTGTSIAPLANADISLSKLWRQAPAAGTMPPPEPPVRTAPPPPPPWPAPIGAIWPPLYVDMPDTAQLEVEDRPIDPAMPAKSLLDDTAAGATRVRLSDAIALAVGDVIMVDADDDGRCEIVEVAVISLSATPNDWAIATLSNPLALSHRHGRIVRRLQATIPAPMRQLNYAGAKGDTALLIDMTAIAGTHQVRIVDSGPPVARSYHRLSAMTAKSDAEGFFRLPPLSRAGKIEIFAKDSLSAASVAAELVPDYTVPETQIDLIVS